MDSNLQFIFNKIYNENLWGSQESRSGPGSTLGYTEELRRVLPQFLKMLECKSLFDAPCGDFNWMKEVDIGEMKYIGADIVAELIENNKKHHSNANRNFEVLDVTTDKLPEADVWLCRDLLIHLPNMSIMNLIKQFINSKMRYLVTTHFPWSGENFELIAVTIGRPINLTQRPFFLPDPLYTIKDFTSGSSRSLGVWSREMVAGTLKKQQENLALILG